jgi:DNA-binding response OmpR family regulator
MRIDLSGLKFIIVAGAELAAEDLSDSLERRGATVVVAPDCGAAFAAIAQQRPDFAVLDWGMSDCEAVARHLNGLDIPHI